MADEDRTVASTPDALNIQERRRRINPEDEFFAEGNYERCNSFRMIEFPDEHVLVGMEDCNFVSELQNVITCPEASCQQRFHSLSKYEEHKFKYHQHICSVCSRSFLTDRLLSIHISELHDHYFAAMVRKKKATYECLVEGCTTLLWSDEERRCHLISHHAYHPSYDFHNPKKYLRRYRRRREEDKSRNTSARGDKQDRVVEEKKTRTINKDKPSDGFNKNAHAPMKVDMDNKSQSGNRASRRAAKQAAYWYRTEHGESPTVPETRMIEEEDHKGNFAVPGSLSSAVTSVTGPACVPLVPQQAPLPTHYQQQQQQPRSSGQESTEVQGDEHMVCIDSLVNKFSEASIHIPSKISFGRRKGRHHM
mmetsp:Transcript_13461/g.22457  ORF Transcript_13461/g.22457 Transcript_13461/m.22457 type:complete len:364 (+) Transcript_13461:48-1139(+)